MSSYHRKPKQAQKHKRRYNDAHKHLQYSGIKFNPSPSYQTCPECMAGWCAKLGIVTPDASLEPFDASFGSMGLEIFNGKRVVFRIDGDLLIG